MAATPSSARSGFPLDVVIIGGCGHVGLPLALALADSGSKVAIYDVSAPAVALVNGASMPFAEDGAQPVLERVVSNGRLTATVDPAVVAEAETVLVVIGTPVDEHLNPDPHAIPTALGLCVEHLRDGQLLVLRSTVFPGVTELVERMLRRRGLDLDVAFCPERIAEGKAMTELYSLPQIVSGRTEQARRRAADLFGRLTKSIIELEPEEAELAKLFTNAWRYVKFATVNQFYMIANSRGLDFERIRAALTADYPRAADMPRAGLAAGPCLLKDTMQLAAFNDNNFHLGHSAMLVNEGLPLYIVSRLEATMDLTELTVGILGASFKAGSDDTRSSLAYKLKRILRFKAKEVLMTDPYVDTDDSLVTLDEVLERSDVLIVATPHPEYHRLQVRQPVADVWDVLGGGVLI